MQSDKITNTQGFMLTVFVLMTNAYSAVYGASAGAEAAIANLVATAVAAICAAFLARVCDAYPEKSFFAVLEALLGAFFGKICAVLLVILALTSGVVSLVVFNRFVQLTALPSTPQIIIPLVLITVSALSFRSGMRSVAGSARLLFWFTIFVFAVFVGFGINFALPKMFVPSLGNIKGIVIATAEVFMNRFGVIFALMTVYTRMSRIKNRRRVFVSAVITSGVAFSVIALITSSILGSMAVKRDFYPAFTAMSIIEVGGFINHPEILSSILMTMCAFFKIAVCILFADDMISGILKTAAKEGMAVPIGLICVSATQLIYRNAPALRKMTEWRAPAAFVLAFEVLLPALLIFIFAVSKRRRKKLQ